MQCLRSKDCDLYQAGADGIVIRALDRNPDPGMCGLISIQKYHAQGMKYQMDIPDCIYS